MYIHMYIYKYNLCLICLIFAWYFLSNLIDLLCFCIYFVFFAYFVFLFFWYRGFKDIKTGASWNLGGQTDWSSYSLERYISLFVWGCKYISIPSVCSRCFGYPVVCTLCVGECLIVVIYFFQAKARRGLRIEFF